MQVENKTKWEARTDLALEMTENLSETEVEDGISMEVNHSQGGKIKETIIRIKNFHGEQSLGRPCGCYITIEGGDLAGFDENYHKDLSQVLEKRLETMLKSYEHILVVGLGNQDVTSDSLGPAVVKNLYITRHLKKEGLLDHGKTLSAISPGVMAQTGMETGEIIASLVKNIKPDVILAIDALAARNSRRLNKTVQIADTGIAPGSGVGNHRKEITKKTMGVDVIGIGVPTVISVPTLINDALSPYLEEGEEWDVSGSLHPELAEMFVTPKNIDEAVKKISYTISEALNQLAVET